MATGERTTHTENLARLSRIEGQVRGLKRMVEEEAYCVEILTQMQAVQSALRAVERNILHKHMHHCVAAAARSASGTELDEKIDEVMALMKRSCR